MEKPLRRLGMPDQHMSAHFDLPVGMPVIPDKDLVQDLVRPGIIQHRNHQLFPVQLRKLGSRAGTHRIAHQSIRFQLISERYPLKMCGDDLPHLRIIRFKPGHFAAGKPAHLLPQRIPEDRYFLRLHLLRCLRCFRH